MARMRSFERPWIVAMNGAVKNEPTIEPKKLSTNANGDAGDGVRLGPEQEADQDGNGQQLAERRDPEVPAGVADPEPVGQAPAEPDAERGGAPGWSESTRAPHRRAPMS